MTGKFQSTYVAFILLLTCKIASLANQPQKLPLFTSESIPLQLFESKTITLRFLKILDENWEELGVEYHVTKYLFLRLSTFSLKCILHTFTEGKWFSIKPLMGFAGRIEIPNHFQCLWVMIVPGELSLRYHVIL